MGGVKTAPGSDLVSGALEGYLVLEVSGKGEGMGALRKMLAQRFNCASRATPPEPPPPTPSPARDRGS